jgi:hypothetical protein
MAVGNEAVVTRDCRHHTTPESPISLIIRWQGSDVHAIYGDDLSSVTKCHMGNRQSLPSDFNAQRRRIIQHTAHSKKLST